MNIAGIILATGEAKRMGKNKLLLSLGNYSIIERVNRVYLKVYQEQIKA